MEEEEGGRDWRGEIKRRRGLLRRIYICISTLDLVIRRRKNQLPPKTLSGHCMYYLFSSSANIREWFSPFVYFVFVVRGVFRFAGTACRARGSVRGLLYLSRYNHQTVWSAGPGSAHTSELISVGCWCALKYCGEVISVSVASKDVHA